MNAFLDMRLRVALAVAAIGLQAAAGVAVMAESWHRAFLFANAACFCWAAVSLLYAAFCLAAGKVLLPLLREPSRPPRDSPGG